MMDALNQMPREQRRQLVEEAMTELNRVGVELDAGRYERDVDPPDAPRATNAMTRRSAFIVIEPLIVIAIVGVIIALALPALSASHKAAESPVCLSNLRQVGVMLNSYLVMPGAWGGRGGPGVRIRDGP